MSKEQRSNKESKKKPLLTAKEKRAQKKGKKDVARSMADLNARNS
jgi:hypothetical protein